MELRAYLDSDTITQYLKSNSGMNLAHVDVLEQLAIVQLRNELNGIPADKTVSVDVLSRRATVPLSKFVFRLHNAR